MRTNPTMQHLRPARAGSGAARLAGAAVLALSLGACGTVDRLATTNSVVATDYRERHPIVVADEPLTIEIFPAGEKLSLGDKSRIRDFVLAYKASARGPVSILMPQGGPFNAHSRHGLDLVKRELTHAGLRGSVQVGAYPANPVGQASPIRISFLALKGRVATRCGDWPDDLASASSLDGWNNKPYWNMGCAYQQMLAAQTADPRDLASPRGEDPLDVAMRLRAIGKVRDGADPGTDWKVRNTQIGTTGGQ